jgi:hypothetical protein
VERKIEVLARGKIFGKKWVKDIDVIGADATLTLPRRTGLTGNAVRQKISRAGVPPRSLKLQKGTTVPGRDRIREQRALHTKEDI